MIAIPLVLAFIFPPAEDVTGRWTGTVQMRMDGGRSMDVPVVLILKQDGDRITGTGGPGEGNQVELRKGKLDGNRLTFEAEAEGATYTLDGTVAGDQISGTMKRRSGDGSEQ